MDSRYFFVPLIIISCLSAPVIAGTRYESGGPAITAAIVGSNEYTPGQDVIIVIRIENSGLFQGRIERSGIIERDDPPNKAKMVTATLGEGETPLIVRTATQQAGDLPGGTSTVVKFSVTVPSDAPAGEFKLPLEIEYIYLKEEDQETLDRIRSVYNNRTETVTLPIYIRSHTALSVLSSRADQLNPGAEGYLELLIENAGEEYARSAVIQLSTNGNSMVIPTDRSMYAGDLAPGATALCRFRVGVSGDANAQEYPIDVSMSYKNTNGEETSTPPLTIGVPVNEEARFECASSRINLTTGDQLLEVPYLNSGDEIVYDAQARISLVDPFSGIDDTAYLGDLGPGEVAVARYRVGIDPAATGNYSLDSEVRYHDARKNSRIADVVKIHVSVAGGGPPPLLVLVTIPALVAIGCVSFVVLRRKK